MIKKIVLIGVVVLGFGLPAFGQTATFTPTATITPTRTPTLTHTPTPLVGGVSDFGTATDRGAVKIHANEHDNPALLILETVTSGGVRVPYYIWVDGTGDLRIHTHAPSDQDADGTVIGGQS